MRTLSVLVLVASPCLAYDDNAFLKAEHQVESPSSAVGHAGEVGPYQFTCRTWHQMTALPFADAASLELATPVAKKYEHWIQKILTRHGVAPSVHNVALAWKVGVYGVIRGDYTAADEDYANRVVNLEAEYERQGSSAVCLLLPLKPVPR